MCELTESIPLKLFLGMVPSCSTRFKCMSSWRMKIRVELRELSTRANFPPRLVYLKTPLGFPKLGVS